MGRAHIEGEEHMTDEDEAFDAIEKAQGWRKRQTVELDVEEHAIAHVRNQTLEEVAHEIERFTFAFGVDTVASFAAFVRSMKDE